MEQFVLLFLLAIMKNPDMKDSLQSALNFYRENRELIALLLNGTTQQSAQSEKKDRPCEEAGTLNNIEEFLRAHV